MKLTIKVGGKNLVEPQFKIYGYEGRNDLILIGIIGLNHEAQISILQAFKNGGYKIYVENGVLGIEIKDDLYSFNINRSGYFNNFLNVQNKECYYLGFVFSDEYGTFKEGEMSVIMMSRE